MYFYDTETCGLHGPAVLIQYAIDDGPVVLHNIWKLPIIDTLTLIEDMMANEVCGFNLVFDQFQLSKIYNMLRLHHDYDAYPEDIIIDLANQEVPSQEGPCLRPKAALDLMLHARKGPFQSTMNRKPIRIKRIPTILAENLAKKLEELIPLNNIYFARRKRKAPQWQVRDTDDPMFKDLEMKFEPSTALKALALHALGIEEDRILLLGDIGIDKTWYPKEDKYVPYGSNWPEVIRHHISYWAFNRFGKMYAENDVIYTRDLYKYFGSPPTGDVDSELACMVAAVRWKGYKVDISGLKELRKQAHLAFEGTPTAPNMVMKYITMNMSDTEKIVMKGTGKVILQEVMKWGDHPAAKAAREVMNAREAQKEVELYDKLIKAGKFHAGFRIIGTKSTRMSGSDGLNPQGIKKDGKVRSKFPLSPDGMVLCGGDFSSFEVSLMEAEWKDKNLREQLLSGKKIHAIFATKLYPGCTYEEVMAEEKAGVFNNKYINGTRYKDGKQGIFGMGYGGTEFTLESKLGIPHDIAVKAFEDFGKDYTGVAAARQKIFDMFCSMRQPNGIGTAVEWHEPKEYIESMFGFKRYFTLENKICKALYDLAQEPPKEWKRYKLKVTRRDRQQTAVGALQSALYGAAFQIQSANMRAAGNHVIQSPGATLTKQLQYELWELQPRGICKWHIMPMNVHDEIMAPMLPDLVNQATNIVETFVKKNKEIIPLLKIKWKEGIQSWGEK